MIEAYGRIADEFRTAVRDGRRLQKQPYYTVQAQCTDALATAPSAAKVALFCAAQLARRLGRELEDGAIESDAEGHWHAYADALEAAIRLAASEKSPQEILWALSAAIAKIIPPTGRP